jgi:hypothetical protein
MNYYQGSLLLAVFLSPPPAYADPKGSMGMPDFTKGDAMPEIEVELGHGRICRGGSA